MLPKTPDYLNNRYIRHGNISNIYQIFRVYSLSPGWMTLYLHFISQTNLILVPDDVIPIQRDLQHIPHTARFRWCHNWSFNSINSSMDRFAESISAQTCNNIQAPFPDLWFIEGQTNCFKNRSEKLFPFSKAGENFLHTIFSASMIFSVSQMITPILKDLPLRRLSARLGWCFG